MKVVYALEKIEHDPKGMIFLAGPTPRSEDVESWRLKAIDFFCEQGYDGTLLIPETADGTWKHNYNSQISWEKEGLGGSDCIMFWIPRDLRIEKKWLLGFKSLKNIINFLLRKSPPQKMPAFTTNIEWGRYATSGRVVLGFPKTAPKMGYFIHEAKEYNIPTAHTLEETVSNVITHVQYVKSPEGLMNERVCRVKSTPFGAFLTKKGVI